MLLFLLELLPALLLGFWGGRRHPGLSAHLAMPLVRFGVPVSVMGLLLGVAWGRDGALGPSLAVLAIIVVLLMAQRLPGLNGLHRPSLRLGSCVGNTAYVGIPLALAFLPTEALPISIGYDLGATLLTWSLGPLFIGARGGRSHCLERLVAQPRQQPCDAWPAGSASAAVDPWRSVVAEALWWPSRLVIAGALVVVGMRLGSLSRHACRGRRRARDWCRPCWSSLALYPVLLLVLGLCCGLIH
ncbi:MAG: hypothetical protein CM15mP77_0570 [Synechococcus sp.]|nr:MAG: hypothetical protein CM15mP77_0570 [Synechococcus sp.]